MERGKKWEAKIVQEREKEADGVMDGATWSTNPHLSVSRCRRHAGGGGGRAARGKERKLRPGPDNGELSGLRRGVGDISQIRTDHKPLNAIQFCGATIRRLIMCHPSIRPPPAALSLAINPLMTNSTRLQSPLSTSSLSPCLCLHYPLCGLLQRESEKGD